MKLEQEIMPFEILKNNDLKVTPERISCWSDLHTTAEVFGISYA
jgi:hypothetical protein